MTRTMKAAVIEGMGGRIAIQDMPVPEVKEGSVLLKVEACAVCGSDIRIYDSGNNRVKYPAIIGHEMAGEIVEVGKGVGRFKSGDKVAIGADVPCGSCHWCQNGMANCCDENFAMGYQFQGGYAQYCLLEPMVVQYGPVTPISKKLKSEHAAIAEPLACCINGFERGLFVPGRSVLVIGAGPIGILLVQLGKNLGASKTFLCDTNPERLEMSKMAGADHMIDSSRVDLVSYVMDVTGGQGVDLIFTACPSPDAHEAAVKMVAKRGCINLFGGLPKNARNINVNSNNIHYREAYITGSHGSTPRHHMMAIDLITSGRINVERLITHKFRLEDIGSAFDVVRNQRGLKAVVLPN